MREKPPHKELGNIHAVLSRYILDLTHKKKQIERRQEREACAPSWLQDTQR